MPKIRPTPPATSDAPTPVSPTPVEAPLSEAQEIPFLPPREGRVWSLVEVDRSVRDVRDLIGDADAESGKRVWRIGDKLLELYNGFPERAKGAPTFIDWATVTFDRGKEDIHEFMRARRAVENAEVAGKIGRAKIRRGVRLLDPLGIQTFATLATKEIPLPGGGSCRFPAATVRQLDDALALLTNPVPPKNAPVSVRAKELARERNAALKEARKEFPVLRTLHMRYVPRGADVYFETGPVSSKQRVALAKLILKLEGAE